MSVCKYVFMHICMYVCMHICIGYLVTLIIDNAFTLDSTVSDEEGLRLRGSLIKQQIALGEVDPVHVLGHLCVCVCACACACACMRVCVCVRWL